METVETIINKYADSANESMDSFEDAIEHLDVSDDAHLSIHVKATSEDRIQSTTLTDTISDNNKGVLVSSPVQNSDLKVSVESNVNLVESAKIITEENKISTEETISNKATNNVGLSNEPALSLINDEKSETTNVDIISNNLAGVNINKADFETSVPSDFKSVQNELSVKDNLMAVDTPTVTSDLDKTKVTINEKSNESAETKLPNEIAEDDPSKVSANESNAQVTLEKETTKKDKSVEEVPAETVSKEPVNERVSVNSDNLPNILKVDQEVTKIPEEFNSDAAIDNDVQPKSNVDKEKNDEDISDSEDGISIKSEREQGDGQGEQVFLFLIVYTWLSMFCITWGNENQNKYPLYQAPSYLALFT